MGPHGAPWGPIGPPWGAPGPPMGPPGPSIVTALEPLLKNPDFSLNMIDFCPIWAIFIIAH